LQYLEEGAVGVGPVLGFAPVRVSPGLGSAKG
jgi:hypothetical protein